MKGFNKLNELKNLKFHSVIPQDILQAVSLLEKLGYEVVRNDFSADDAAEHNGVCAWDDGEITEGWLDDDNFVQVTLEELKEMVGDGIKDNAFTLERLLGCEVLSFGETSYIDQGFLNLLKRLSSGFKCEVRCFLSSLTFFTEDGDELTYDGYVNKYYCY